MGYGFNCVCTLTFFHKVWQRAHKVMHGSMHCPVLKSVLGTAKQPVAGCDGSRFMCLMATSKVARRMK